MLSHVALNCHFCELEDRTATTTATGLTSNGQRGENISAPGWHLGKRLGTGSRALHSREPLSGEIFPQERCLGIFGHVMLTMTVSLSVIPPPQGPVRINNSIPDMQTYPCQLLTSASPLPILLARPISMPPSVAQASPLLDHDKAQVLR